jgi:hypothetical protein
MKNPTQPTRRSNSANKKKQLLEMAKRGEGRPSKRRHELGSAFSTYVGVKGRCYDPDFTNQIKELAPHWFIDKGDSANKKKQPLLEMAKSGEQRPSQKTKLGQSLSNYIRTTSSSYDPGFTKQIKELAPHWFINQNPNDKKKQLLEIAKKGEERPNWKSKLGQNLRSYINDNYKCYDPDFTKQIKELAPHWLKRREKSSES